MRSVRSCVAMISAIRSTPAAAGAFGGGGGDDSKASGGRRGLQGSPTRTLSFSAIQREKFPRRSNAKNW